MSSPWIFPCFPVQISICFKDFPSACRVPISIGRHCLATLRRGQRRWVLAPPQCLQGAVRGTDGTQADDESLDCWHCHGAMEIDGFFLGWWVGLKILRKIGSWCFVMFLLILENWKLWQLWVFAGVVEWWKERNKFSWKEQLTYLISDLKCMRKADHNCDKKKPSSCATDNLTTWNGIVCLECQKRNDLDVARLLFLESASTIWNHVISCEALVQIWVKWWESLRWIEWMIWLQSEHGRGSMEVHSKDLTVQSVVQGVDVTYKYIEGHEIKTMAFSTDAPQYFFLRLLLLWRSEWVFTPSPAIFCGVSTSICWLTATVWVKIGTCSSISPRQGDLPKCPQEAEAALTAIDAETGQEFLCRLAERLGWLEWLGIIWVVTDALNKWEKGGSWAVDGLKPFRTAKIFWGPNGVQMWQSRATEPQMFVTFDTGFQSNNP